MPSPPVDGVFPPVSHDEVLSRGLAGRTLVACAGLVFELHVDRGAGRATRSRFGAQLSETGFLVS
jgi:hypothetical protein